MPEHCNRRRLLGYLRNTLDLEEKLDFLFHVDHCTRCWEDIYNYQKAQHPHWYRQNSRGVKISDKELSRIEGRERPEAESELVEVA